MNRFHRYRVWRAVSAVQVYFGISCLLLALAGAILVLGLHRETDSELGVIDDFPEHRVSKRFADGEGDENSPPGLGIIHAPAHDVNCTPPSIDNFPHNIMSVEVLRHGGFLINLAAVCYMFGVLALVCDSYFMSSLEILCADLNLSEDVAGASFMAIGGSAPELFTSIFGVFIAKGNIGVGTVIGSAVFNILCVIGLCALLAGQIVYLSKWPLARDFLCYVVTVVALVLVIWDNMVMWWESFILIVLYIAYLVFLYFDPPIKARVRDFCVCCKDDDRNSDDDDDTISKTTSETESTPIIVAQSWMTSSFGTDHSSEISAPEKQEPTKDVEPSTLSPFVIPDGCFKRLVWLIGFPPALLLYLTIPNCSLERWRKWYPVTFLVALAWIGAVTYLLVWMVTVLGYVFNLPDTVMGLTLLAAGSSTPDTILSVIAARNGYGDMAICHSIGSNIFDILLGLGFPWFMHSIAVDHGHAVPTYSDGLTIIAAMLLVTVVVSLVIIKLSSFQLTKKIGAMLIACYVVFLVPAILLEMNILIKGLILPECPRQE